jgi:hypothetical protein
VLHGDWVPSHDRLGRHHPEVGDPALNQTGAIQGDGSDSL